MEVVRYQDKKDCSFTVFLNVHDEPTPISQDSSLLLL